MAFQFDVPLTQLKPGTYVCQVNRDRRCGRKLQLSADGDDGAGGGDRTGCSDGGSGEPGVGAVTAAVAGDPKTAPKL